MHIASDEAFELWIEHTSEVKQAHRSQSWQGFYFESEDGGGRRLIGEKKGGRNVITEHAI